MCGDGKEVYRESPSLKSAMELLKEAEERQRRKSAGDTSCKKP